MSRCIQYPAGTGAQHGALKENQRSSTPEKVEQERRRGVHSRALPLDGHRQATLHYCGSRAQGCMVPLGDARKVLAAVAESIALCLDVACILAGVLARFFLFFAAVS